MGRWGPLLSHPSPPRILETHEAILLFLCGLAITVATTPLVIRLCSNGWGVDEPNQFRKSHEGRIPRLGGIPVFLSLLASLGVGFYFRTELFLKWWPLILCNFLIFAVGFLDDIKPVGAKVKLIAQIGIALLAYSLGLRIDILSSPVGAFNIDLGGFSLVVTILWLVALPNIINLIDGMDGLASGIGMFLCLTLGIVGLVSNQMEVSVVSLGMAGALLGFLLFNFPPAKIFLGDGGAYLIGFFIGSVSLASSNKGSVAAALLVVIVALGLPILDTLFAIIRRTARGLPIFRTDAEHIHHRLIVLGFSKNAALIAIYSVCVVLSLIGISIFWSKGQTLPIAGAAFFIFALIAARYLGYIRNWSQFHDQIQHALSRRKDVQYATLLAKLLELETDRFETPEPFWKEFDTTLERVGLISGTRILREDIDSGRMKLLELSLDPRRSWALYYPTVERDLHYWRRIGDCFHPTYANALAHWGTSPRPGEIITAQLDSDADGSGDQPASQDNIAAAARSGPIDRLTD